MTFSLNIIQNKESDINLIEAIGDRMFLFKPRRASQIWHCTHAQPKNRQIQRLFFGSRWVMRVMHIRVQNHCFWEIRVSKILSDSQLGPHLYFAQFTNLGSSCFKTGCTKNLFKGCFGRRHKTHIGIVLKMSGHACVRVSHTRMAPSWRYMTVSYMIMMFAHWSCNEFRPIPLFLRYCFHSQSRKRDTVQS